MTLLTIVYIKTIDFYIIPILFVTFQRFAVVVTYFNKITYLLTYLLTIRTGSVILRGLLRIHPCFKIQVLYHVVFI